MIIDLKTVQQHAFKSCAHKVTNKDIKTHFPQYSAIVSPVQVTFFCTFQKKKRRKSLTQHIRNKKKKKQKKKKENRTVSTTINSRKEQITNNNQKKTKKKKNRICSKSVVITYCHIILRGYTFSDSKILVCYQRWDI